MEPQRVTESPARRSDSQASPSDGLIVVGILLVVLAVALLAGVAWALGALGSAAIVAGVAMGRAGR